MLRIGDIVEVLKPENEDNYPYLWMPDMDNYIGTQTRIERVCFDYRDRVCYHLSNNGWIWNESNLKLISRKTENKVFEINETVIIANGLYKGKIDTIINCYKQNGEYVTI